MKKFLNQFQYITQFIPFRLNFFVFSLLGFLIYTYIIENQTDTSSFYGFLVLMSKIAFWLLTILLLLSFLSTLLSWIYYLRSGEQLQLRFFQREHARKGNRLNLSASIPNIFKPILGGISTRFLYNDLALSQKFILHRKSSRSFLSLRPGASSSTVLRLPDIKEYQFKGAIIYFEDLFRFFSFASFTELNKQFTNLPIKIKLNEEKAEPKATNAEEIRIDKLKRVDGEWLEYKKYEHSDDIRRIVWKVFARNKELMVRRQETLNPFASHIYFYLSFYNSLDKSYLYPDHLRLMANLFKNISWSILSSLKEQEYEVKLLVGQPIKTSMETDKSEAELISLCDWQNENAVYDWFDPRKGSVLVLHSLMDSEAIRHTLDKCDFRTKIFYVDLLQTFKTSLAKNWLSLFFFLSKKDELSQLKQSWPFHPLRAYLRLNQKKNLALLANCSSEVEII